MTSLADEQDIADLKKQQGWRERRLAPEAFNSRDRARRALVGKREARKNRRIDDEAGQYLWPR